MRLTPFSGLQVPSAKTLGIEPGAPHAAEYYAAAWKEYRRRLFTPPLLFRGVPGESLHWLHATSDGNPYRCSNAGDHCFDDCDRRVVGKDVAISMSTMRRTIPKDLVLEWPQLRTLWFTQVRL